MTTQDQLDTMESMATETRSIIEIEMRTSEEVQQTRGRFVLYSTVAPGSYDHAGVIDVFDNGDGVRWVLIPVALEEAQLGRYRSGLYGYQLSKDPTTDGILSELWRRIQKFPK